MQKQIQQKISAVRPSDLDLGKRSDFNNIRVWTQSHPYNLLTGTANLAPWTLLTFARWRHQSFAAFWPNAQHFFPKFNGMISEPLQNRKFHDHSSYDVETSYFTQLQMCYLMTDRTNWMNLFNTTAVMIEHDTVYLMCSQQLTGRQVSLLHGIKQKILMKNELKIQRWAWQVQSIPMIRESSPGDISVVYCAGNYLLKR